MGVLPRDVMDYWWTLHSLSWASYIKYWVSRSFENFWFLAFLSRMELKIFFYGAAYGLGLFWELPSLRISSVDFESRLFEILRLCRDFGNLFWNDPKMPCVALDFILSKIIFRLLLLLESPFSFSLPSLLIAFLISPFNF